MKFGTHVNEHEDVCPFIQQIQPLWLSLNLWLVLGIAPWWDGRVWSHYSLKGWGNKEVVMWIGMYTSSKRWDVEEPNRIKLCWSFGLWLFLYEMQITQKEGWCQLSTGTRKGLSVTVLIFMTGLAISSKGGCQSRVQVRMIHHTDQPDEPYVLPQRKGILQL